jgi:uncharacterized damage-inducible protein DinB
MNQIKWFDRKFDFSNEQNIFPSIIERLEKTPLILDEKIKNISNKYLIHKKNDKWSIQENIGHLIDLETIWQGRLKDILNNKLELRSADLKNRKTDLAEHNKRQIKDILYEFQSIRRITLNELNNLTEKEIFKFALHPRLKTPMRIMDLFFFVAEHDDYHLKRISELETTYNKELL